MVAHYETLVPGKVTVEADRPAAAGEATFHRMGTPTIDRDDYGLADAEVESLERKRATDIPDSARDGRRIPGPRDKSSRSSKFAS
jgi:hypothetical protein